MLMVLPTSAVCMGVERVFPRVATRGFFQKFSRAVVFNLFHAVAHFPIQFNLTTPFRKFPVWHMKCSCVFTTENHNTSKITYDIIKVNKDSFIKFMHMAALLTETYTVYRSIHSTTH